MNTINAMESVDTIAYPTNSEPRSLRIQKILVPMDFSEGSVAALRYAAGLAQRTGASLTLLHVVDSLIAPMEDLEYTYVDSKSLRAAVEKRANEKLSELARKETDPTAHASPLVRRGTTWEQIIETTKSGGADLIVIGSHGYSGLKRVLLGSTAEKVVRHATCPVLVVR
jgi:universal stress protein A